MKAVQAVIVCSQGFAFHVHAHHVIGCSFRVVTVSVHHTPKVILRSLRTQQECWRLKGLYILKDIAVSTCTVSVCWSLQSWCYTHTCTSAQKTFNSMFYYYGTGQQAKTRRLYCSRLQYSESKRKMLKC